MIARRSLTVVGMLIISCAFFFGMRSFGLLNLDAAAAALSERTGWVAAGAAAQLLTLSLGVVRLGVLLSLFGLVVPMGRVAAATIVSQAIGQYLPGSMAATELIRVGLLLGLGDRGVDGVDPDLSARLMLASVLDRVLGLGSMLMFGGLVAAASFAWPGPAMAAPGIVLGFALVSLAGGAILLAMPLAGRFGRRLPSAGAWREGRTLLSRVMRRLDSLLRAWISHADYAARAPGKLALAIVLGGVSLPVSCLTVWLPAFGGAASIPFWPLVAVVPLLSLATVLPLGLAGFGSQQAFAALALAAFGVSSTAVVTASLIQNVVALLVQSVVGVVAAIAHGTELRALFRGAARRRTESQALAPSDAGSFPRSG